MQKKSLVFIFCSFLLITQGCLKTRTQLREERPEYADTIRNQPAQATPPPQDAVPHSSSYAVDEIKEELTRLQGRIEDLERSQLDQSKKNNSTDHELINELANRIEDLSLQQEKILESIKKFEEAAKKEAASSKTLGSSSDPLQLFKDGKTQFEKENYSIAVEILGRYLKSPKPKKAEEARMLKAESQYRLKKFRKAIEELSEFQDTYPKSPRMPEVLYMIGHSFESLKMKDSALGFYQELIERFPKSKEAEKARKKLK